MYRNRIFSSFIIVSLLAGLLFLFSSCVDQEEPGIRVMSYNIAAGYGNLDGIAEVIAEHEPDIVALQEVDVFWSDRSDFEDQARYLGEALGMHHFYGEIYTLESLENGMPARRYGLAFLSTEPFVHAQNYPLSRLSTQTDPPERIILPGFPSIAVQIHGREIHLFNTHLDYRGDPAMREIQVAEMLDFMQRIDKPRLLLGDLNARPGSPELDPLFDLFIDAWDIRDDPGYTFPEDEPDRRIDYILHTEDFEATDVYVPDTRASDHRPVVADLIFRQ